MSSITARSMSPRCSRRCTSSLLHRPMKASPRQNGHFMGAIRPHPAARIRVGWPGWEYIVGRRGLFDACRGVAAPPNRKALRGDPGFGDRSWSDSPIHSCGMHSGKHRSFACKFRGCRHSCNRQVTRRRNRRLHYGAGALRRFEPGTGSSRRQSSGGRISGAGASSPGSAIGNTWRTLAADDCSNWPAKLVCLDAMSRRRKPWKRCCRRLQASLCP